MCVCLFIHFNTEIISVLFMTYFCDFVFLSWFRFCLFIDSYSTLCKCDTQNTNKYYWLHSLFFQCVLIFLARFCALQKKNQKQRVKKEKNDQQYLYCHGKKNQGKKTPPTRQQTSRHTLRNKNPGSTAESLGSQVYTLPDSFLNYT